MKKIISPEEFSEHERYYRRMMELYPDRFTIILDAPEVEGLKIKQKRKWRKHTNPEQRRLAMERDGCRCRICGSTESLEVHHIKHKADGGTDDIDNLTTLCAKCHAKQHEGEPIHKLMVSRFFNK